MTEFIPSKFQQKIFDTIKFTDKNIAIEATAGSGKTTTIIESLKYIPKFKKTAFLSFSNTIVDELKERVPKHVNASTLHSLGASFIRNYYSRVKFEENKFFIYALNHFKQRDKKTFRKCFLIRDLCNYARLTLTDLDAGSIMLMANFYDLEYDDEMCEIVPDLILNDKYFSMFDFADMIYIPATRNHIIKSKFDFVFYDESQDANQAQLKFVNNLLEKNGRLIAVGDSSQAIYSFMGADINTFIDIQKRQNTVVLPLSESFRCSKAVVKEAQKFCKHIKPHKNAKEGEVREGSIEEIREDDIVVCRNNAPLLDLYFELIDRGVKSVIVGKDIERGLINLYKQCSASTKDKFVSRLYQRLDWLAESLISKGMSEKRVVEDQRYIDLCDKINLFEVLLKHVEKPSQLEGQIHKIFSEDKKACRLMTGHKSKGLEAKRVFLLNVYKGKRLCPSSYARQDWQKVAENNLMFVMITRAEDKLIYIEL